MDHLKSMYRASIVRHARHTEMLALAEARRALNLPNGLLNHWIDSFANGRFNYVMQQAYEQLRHETYFGTED